MKIWISTFNNLKYLKDNQIAVSTAIWDPKWFHPVGQPDGVFKYHLKSQNRDQWYGYRIKQLSPYLASTECVDCKKDHPETCSFLKSYHQQLFEKISFDSVLETLENIQKDFAQKTSIQNAEIVLLVYEKSDNPCSERHSIIELFQKHNYSVLELPITQNKNVSK